MKKKKEERQGGKCALLSTIPHNLIFWGFSFHEKMPFANGQSMYASVMTTVLLTQ